MFSFSTPDESFRVAHPLPLAVENRKLRFPEHRFAMKTRVKFSYATILLVLCAFGHLLHAGEEPDAQYVADLFLAAHQSRTPFPDILKINPALDETFLYDVQERYVALRVAAGSPIGGYKGGFIPQAPIGGVLFANGILRGSPTIDSRDYQGLLVEAEIAFRLCQPAATPLPGVDALKAAVCEIYPAIELPDAALGDLAELRKDFPHLRRLLIPTNVAASHLLLGTGHGPGDIDLDRLDVRVKLDGAEIGFRNGAESTDDIWARVLWTINEFILANGYELTPDHVIIPGALTGLHPGKPGTYSVDYGELGRVDFQVR